MTTNWILESFSIIDGNQELDHLELKREKYIGFYDWLGFEGLDTLIFDKELLKIIKIGLTIPQNFKVDNLEINNIRLKTEISEKDYFLDDNGLIGSLDPPTTSFYDKKSNRLICLNSLDEVDYSYIKITSQLKVLVKNFRYAGFVLDNASKLISTFDIKKSSPLFEDCLNKLLRIINPDAYYKMEELKDELILEDLFSLKDIFTNLKDSRSVSAVVLIDSMLDSFYDIY